MKSFATMVANALGVNLTVAKRNKEVGVKAFIDETYILGKDSGVTVTSLHTKRSHQETR